MQAKPALQERFWQGDKLGFAERELLRDALLQGMGPVLQLIPTSLAGKWAHHSTGVTAKWQQMPGALAVAPWQECQSLPCPILVPLPMSGPERGCVKSGKADCASVLLPPCSYLGWGSGSLGVPSLLGPWVGFPHRRSRRAGMEHSDRHPRCKLSLGVNIWLLSGILCWKAPPPSLLCPFQSYMGVIDPSGRSQRSRSWVTELPPALHRDVSQAVFSACAA